MWLGIDTSGAVSVAVARGDTSAHVDVTAVRSDARARHHDEVLLSMIDEVLADAGARRSDLTGVVAGRGPGPFTGLRVGLIVSRTIATVLGIPLHGVCSLDALAHQALAEAGPPSDAPAASQGRSTPGAMAAPDAGNSHHARSRTVAVALDARRREIYHATYRSRADGSIERLTGPAVAAPADVAAELTGADLLVGSGAALYPELLHATSSLTHADAGHLLAVAAQLAAQGEDLSTTEPLYLRDPDAAKPTARKSALGLPPEHR